MQSRESPHSIIARIVPFIRERRFEPGDRIPSERALAERFQVSRSVIREALATLEAMRVIERRPQSGIFLREVTREGSLDAVVLQTDLGIPMTEREVRSLCEFRSTLELQAAALAADRRTDADLEALDAILTATRKLIASRESTAEEDSRFHLAVFAAAKNQYLERAAHSFYLASRQRRERYFLSAQNRKRSLLQHERIRDAIEKCDIAGARNAMVEHLGGVERFWLSMLPRERR
jgi:GntR family transcriptional regulator, transcriptional repressor for pyruvate dehydrogenase complex